jgi:hypothetical protein
VTIREVAGDSLPISSELAIVLGCINLVLYNYGQTMASIKQEDIDALPLAAHFDTVEIPDIEINGRNASRSSRSLQCLLEESLGEVISEPVTLPWIEKKCYEVRVPQFLRNDSQGFEYVEWVQDVFKPLKIRVVHHQGFESLTQIKVSAFGRIHVGRKYRTLGCPLESPYA